MNGDLVGSNQILNSEYHDLIGWIFLAFHLNPANYVAECAERKALSAAL